MARAYLDIMRVRLGERLVFEIDVPDLARSARMPPMMLLPLIDHALVYGLEPGDGRGSIRIQTDVRAGRLRLQMTDSGAGFVPGAAVDGLASIAERLEALYGDDAVFELERMRDRGTQATLEIPYETPTCVIAEDEPDLREELRETLAVLWPELRIVAEVEDGIKAAHALHEHAAPAALSRHRDAGHERSWRWLRRRAGRCHVVFVTAYDQHAIAAFEQGAVDYVLKPFSPARLAGTVSAAEGTARKRASKPRAGCFSALCPARGRAKTHLRWIHASQGTERAPHHGRVRSLLLSGRQQVHDRRMGDGRSR